EPEPPLRQHRSARLQILPHALGSDRERRLSTEQFVQSLLARAVLDVPELGSEGSVHAERWGRAGGEHRLAAGGDLGGEHRREWPPYDGPDLADVGRLGVTLAEFGRQRRGEFQMVRRESEL